MKATDVHRRLSEKEGQYRAELQMFLGKHGLGFHANLTHRHAQALPANKRTFTELCMGLSVSPTGSTAWPWQYTLSGTIKGRRRHQYQRIAMLNQPRVEIQTRPANYHPQPIISLPSIGRDYDNVLMAKLSLYQGQFHVGRAAPRTG